MLLNRFLLVISICFSNLFAFSQSESELLKNTKSADPVVSQTAYIALAKANLQDSAKAANYLQKVLVEPNQLADSTYRNFMNQKIYCYSKIYAHKAGKEVAHKGIIRAKQNNDSLLLSNCYKQLSSSCYKLRELDSTSFYLNLAGDLYEALNDLENLGLITLRRGGVEYTRGNYEQALKLAFEAAEIFKETKEEKQLAIAYMQMGNIYYFLKEYQEASDYYDLSAGYYLMIEDSVGWAFATSNKSLVNIELENYEVGLELQYVSLPLIKSSGRLESVGNAYQYMGLAHLGLGNLDSAEYYIDASDQINKKVNYVEGHAFSLINKARIADKKGELKRTLRLADEAIRLIDTLPGIEAKKELHFFLKDWYAANGNYQKAFESYKIYTELRDSNDLNINSLGQLAKNEKMQLAEAEYELKLAKQRELLSNQKNQSYYSMLIVLSIVIIITLFFTGVLSSRSRKVRLLNTALQEKQKEIEQELTNNQALLKEVHHRVKNNLQVISSMLSIQSSSVNDKETQTILMECKSRILSMSLIHESLYKKEGKKASLFSTYIKELLPQLLETYHLDENKVELKMSIEDLELSLDDSIPCGLIINEVVTNTLKHAFPNDKAGEIYIEMKQEGNYNYLKLADNGIGIPEEINAEEQGSFGFLLIYTLAEQLEADIKLDTSPKGTVFNIKWEVKKDKLLS